MKLCALTQSESPLFCLLDVARSPLFKRSVGGQVTGSTRLYHHNCYLLYYRYNHTLNWTMQSRQIAAQALCYHDVPYPRNVATNSTHMCWLTTRCNNLQPSYATCNVTVWCHHQLRSNRYAQVTANVISTSQQISIYPMSQHRSIHKCHSIHEHRSICDHAACSWTIHCSTWRCTRPQ